MTTPSSFNAKNALKAVQILATALPAGVLLMAGALVAVRGLQEEDSTSSTFAEMGNNLPLILGGAGLLFFFLASNLYNKKIAEAKSYSLPLAEKMSRHRSALIIYMALCEMPALLAAILFYLSGNHWLLLVTGLLWLAMLFKYPSLERLSAELELSNDEILQLKG